MNRSKTILIPAFMLALLLSSSLWAQTSTGTIVGNVTDSSGGVLPGAEVTVRNEATNLERTALTNDSGFYRIPNLPPGSYEVKAAFTGFKTIVSSANSLTVAESLTINLALEVGDIADVVTVSSQAIAVDTQDAQISSLVDKKRIADLPLNGRNVFTLATLQAGVVPAMGAVAQTGGPNSSSFVAAGTRARGNAFSLDGGHNTNDGISGLPVVNPSVDAVQEFRLIRNNFSAEYGTHSGSVISVVTKSGSNRFHGTAYEFHRNDAVDAAGVFDNFNTQTGQKDKAPLIQNQFGFTLGGPIVKDKVFFFGSYEGFRQRSGNSVVNTVETPEFRSFVIANFPGNASAQIFQDFPSAAPTSNIQTVQDIIDSGGTACLFCDLSLFPADLPVRGQASAFASAPNDSDQYNIRADVNFSDRTQLFGRYTIEDGNSSNPFGVRPDFASVNENVSQQVNITLTHAFTPTVLNEGRFSYIYGRSDFIATNPHVPDVFVQGSRAGISGTIGISLGQPQLFQRDTFQYQDIVSFNVGDHYLRAGVDLRRAREDSNFGNSSRPANLYVGLFDFAQDAPYYIQAGIDPQTGTFAGTPREFRSTEFGWFIQDDWKATPRLTLNLGLRWDYFGPTTEANGQLSSIRFTDDPSFFQRVADAFVGPVDSLYNDDYNNFAPRFGFAYDLFGNSKTSLRGGYGLSYDKIFFNVGANARFNPPFFGLAQLSNIFFGDDLSGLPLIGPDPNDLFGGFLGLPVGPPLGFDARGGPIGQRVSLRVLDPKIRDSYVHSTFLGLQHELPWDMVAEFNYQGTLGHKLGFIGNPNRFNGDLLGLANPLGQFGGSNLLDRINPSFASFNLRENRINSNYHGFNAQLSKRFTNGLAFQAAYTWGHSLDLNSDVFGGNTDIFGTDALNLANDYGRSDFDIRQRFVGNLLYEIPLLRDQQGWAGKALGGWQVNAIVPIQSGLPLGVTHASSAAAGGDFNRDGTTNDRPNQGSIGSEFASDPSTADFIAGVFRATDFLTPTPGTNGNLGRNTFTGPAFWTVDLSIFKDFRIPINEESRLQFRAEFFNLLNRVNLQLPVANLGSSLFGRSTSAFAPREIQFAFKIIF